MVSDGSESIGLVSNPSERTPLARESAAGMSRSLGLKDSLTLYRSSAMATTSRSVLGKPSDDRHASALLAGWNVTILIQGTGILGIPYSVKMGGWAAMAAIALVALVCCYTGKILIECLYVESRRTGVRRRLYTNYPEVGEAAWPRWGNRVVSVIQVCEMFGGTIMYIVLLATIFSSLLEGLTPLDMYQWSVACALCALPLMFITRMSLIAWISMFAVFALLSSIATIIIFCITEYSDMTWANMPGFDPQKFPVGFGVIVFSYTAHAVFPGVEGSMQEPKQYPMMMNVSFLVAAVVKLILGLLAVLRFGQETEQSITLNMAISKVFSLIATILVIGNVFLSFPINLFVVLETWDTKVLPYFPHLAKGRRHHWFWLLLSRVMILTFALFMSIIVPHFALVMGLVGSFTGTCLSFVFPCIFHMKLKWERLRWYNIVINVVVIIFGVVCGAFGLFFSGRELARAFTAF